MVSNRVNTWVGSLVELHDVNPAMSANITVVSGYKSAIGWDLYMKPSSSKMSDLSVASYPIISDRVPPLASSEKAPPSPPVKALTAWD